MSPNKYEDKDVINFTSKYSAEMCINYDFDYNKLLYIFSNKIIHIETTHGCEYFYKHNILDKFKFIIDIHGAAPEEELLINNSDINYWNSIEKKSIEHSIKLLTVNKKMIRHLEVKYNLKLEHKCFVIYIFTIDTFNILKNGNIHNFEMSRSGIVYSGGLQIWQNIDYILDNVVNKTLHKIKFFTHDKNLLQMMLKNKNIKFDLNNIMTFNNSDELKKKYKLNKYGLILRNNCIINRVSCPTKLEEYISNGLVPVFFKNQDTLGDFDNLKYVDIEFITSNMDLSNDKYSDIVNHNMNILFKLLKLSLNNIDKFTEFI